jgi:hypothetical protein
MELGRFQEGKVLVLVGEKYWYWHFFFAVH